MKILGFVEGAFRTRGGMGLVGTPTILASLAAQHNRTVLLVAGPPSPGRDRLVAANLDEALSRPEGRGAFGMVSFPATSAWAFSPSMIVPAMRHARDADFISLHSFFSFPVLLGYCLARLYRKPYGIWPHGVFGNLQRRSGSVRKNLYHAFIGKRMLDHASILFYSAEGERDEAAALGANVPTAIIPDGIDMSDFDSLPPKGRFRQRYFDGHSGPLVVFIARLTSKKGIDLLVDAMVRVCDVRPDVRLAIIGGPDPAPFIEKVRAWVTGRNIADRTKITGQVSPAEKLEALVDADVFVLPSQVENFGFSMFEAMACRVPVVVSDTLDFSARVASAQAGLVVRREPVAFADAILSLIGDPALRLRLGANGFQLAQHFSLNQTGVMLNTAIRGVVKSVVVPPDLSESVQVPDVP